ncbi:MAG: putative membrane protein YkoI, partial [Rhodothermales bacterium]
MFSMRAYLLASLFVCSLVAHAETRLRSSQIPSALRKAIEKRFSGHKFVDAYKDREDGDTVYEVVIEHQGDHYIVLGDSREIRTADLAEEDDGEEVLLADLPRAVRIAAERSITSAKIVGAFRLEGDNGTYYEVIVETKRADHLLVLTPSGRLLERRELEEN